MKLNTKVIPNLAIGFSRSSTFIGDAIRLFDGGFSAVGALDYPNHAFPFVWDRGSLFAEEEDADGLKQDSLSDYETENNRIIAVYYWTGWDDPDRVDAALKWLAAVRAAGGPAAKYNFQFLWSRLPVIGRFWKRATGFNSMVCSQECARLMMKFGCPFITTDDLSPKQLLDVMMNARRDHPDQCECVLGYYI